MTEVQLKEKAKDQAKKLLHEFTIEGRENEGKIMAIKCCNLIMDAVIRGGYVYNLYERVKEEINANQDKSTCENKVE